MASAPTILRSVGASSIRPSSDPGAYAAIVAPAGYPMAAATPEEIALSVLAAVVSKRRQAVAAPAEVLVEVQAGVQGEAPVDVSVDVSADVPEAAPAATAAESPAQATTVTPRVATGGSCCGGAPRARTIQHEEL